MSSGLSAFVQNYPIAYKVILAYVENYLTEKWGSWKLKESYNVKITCFFCEFPYMSYKVLVHYLPLLNKLSIWPNKMDISSVKHDLLQSSQWSYIILHIVTSTKYKCKYKMYSPLLAI